MCLSARTLVVIIVTLFVFATADEVTQSESVDFSKLRAYFAIA